MTLLLRIPARLLYGLAWLVLLLAAALLTLEARGAVTRLAEAQLDALILPAGLHAHVEDARLRWFEPGLDLRGVALTSDGEEVLRVDRLRVRLAPGPSSPRRWVRQARLEGGEVALGSALFEAIRDLEPRRSARGEEPPPRVEVRDLVLLARAPGRADRAVGTLDLDAGPDERGRGALDGTLRPAVSAATPSPAPIRLSGREVEAGLVELSLRVPRLLVDDEHLPIATLAPDLLGSRVGGAVSAEVDARVPTDGSAPPTATLRLIVEEAHLTPVTADATPPPVEELTLAVEARFAPGPREGWLAAQSWDVTARADLAFQGDPVRAWAQLGRGAGEGNLLSAWVAAPDFQLARETLEALHLWERVQNDFTAIEPRGRTDLLAGLRIPMPSAAPPSEDTRPELDYVLDLVHDGRSGVTYRGWQPRADHEREGLPIPIEGLRGRAVLGHDDTRRSALARRERVGLRFVGHHGAGPARLDGTIASPLVGREPDIDAEVEVQRVSVSPGLATALSGLQGTRTIWEDYGPAGGELDAVFRVVRDAAHGGTAAQADVELRGVSLRWAEVPTPLTDVQGTIRARWAERPFEVEREDGRLDGWRPIGVQLDLAARTAGGAHAQIRVASREEVPALAEGEILTLGARGRPGMHRVEVDLDSLALSGPDAAVLREAFPQLEAEVEPFRPSGAVAVRYRGGRDHPSAPFAYTVLALPRDLAVSPRFLPAVAADLRGGLGVAAVVAVSDEEAGGQAPEAAPYVGTRLAGTLIGTWPGETPVVAVVDVGARSSQDEALLAVGGVDPTRRELIAAATQGIVPDSPAVPDSAGGLRITGAVDLDVRLAPPIERGDDWTSAVRVHLRGNDFSSGRFELDRLVGTLTLTDGVLWSERVDAVLGTTPVRVLDARFLERSGLDTLLALDPTLANDPLLTRGGFPPPGPGYIATARLEATDLPLDEAHLGPFFEREALARVREDLGWSGALDVNGARFFVTPDTGGGALVGVHGPIVPSGMSLDLGLPLRGLTGDVELRSLIVGEGGASAWLDVEGLYGSVAGRRLDAADMTLTYLDGRFTIDDLSGRLEGGSIASLGGRGRALALDLVEPHEFDLALQLGRTGDDGEQDADVERLLTGMFDSSVRDRGFLRGDLRLSGQMGHLHELGGSGRIALYDVRIWSIPVVREVLSVLGLDRTAVFDRVETEFTVRDGAIHMDGIEVRSPLLRLVGEGTLDLDGTLDHQFDVRYSLIDRLGPLNQIVYWFQNNLIRVEVHGDLARPQVFLRNGLNDLMGIDPRWRRALPLPDFRPLAPRF